MDSKDNKVKSTGAILAEVEIPINAPKKVVWDTFANKTSEWWGKAFYASKKPAKFKIDLKLGGNMYEDTEDGAGLIWFNILGINEEEMIYVIGYTRPPFGGPATGLITFEFLKKGDNETIFKVSDATFGHVSEELIAGAEAGWTAIFSGLKNYVENN